MSGEVLANRTQSRKCVVIQSSPSLSIAQNLAVSLEGDLRIDDVTEVVVNDLSVTIPLK